MNIWYAHYPGDYGRDTAHLTLAQHGAYRLLLDHYYSIGGPLPSDATALHRICRAFDQTEQKAVDSVLAEFFEPQPDGYHNKRADIEIVRRSEAHERLSNSGRRGAQKRWGQDSEANGVVIARPQSHPQSQSLVTPIKERKAV